MNDTVAAVFKAWPRSVGTDAVFPGLNGPMVTRAFWRACRKADVPNLRLLDLRHTFASYLAMGGFNLWAITALRNYLNQIMSIAENSPTRKEGYHGQEESRAPGAADHLGHSR
jgi:integrase